MDDRARTLPIQPRPIQWLSATIRINNRVVTALARLWWPGDSRRCRLCTQCTACHSLGVCLVVINGSVPAAELPTYSTRGLVDVAARTADRAPRVASGVLGRGNRRSVRRETVG